MYLLSQFSDMLLLCAERTLGSMMHGTSYRCKVKFDVGEMQVIEGDASIEGIEHAFFIRDEERTVQLYTE